MHRLVSALGGFVVVGSAAARTYELDASDNSFALWIPIIAVIVVGQRWGTKAAVAAGALSLGLVMMFPVQATIGLLVAVAGWFAVSYFRS